MNVVWKRPDGFHGAVPEDFVVVQLAGNYNLWLHKQDSDRFPLRISGGWEEETATSKLNKLVNLLNKNDNAWLDHLQKTFNHSMHDNPDDFINELGEWLTNLKTHLKGDHWEITIMEQVLDTVTKKLNLLKSDFLNRTSSRN